VEVGGAKQNSYDGIRSRDSVVNPGLGRILFAVAASHSPSVFVDCSYTSNVRSLDFQTYQVFSSTQTGNAAHLTELVAG
jgi:hypothetical protein